MKSLGWKWLSLAFIVPLLGLSSCANTQYYWQAANGHLGMLLKAQPIDEVIKDPKTPEALKQRLSLSLEARKFASQHLLLPDNASYTRYADLNQKAAVWNVVAAPELSLQPKIWCFWIAGCVSYKGFYTLEAAQLQAKELEAFGYEVKTYPVPAYSSLGWSNLLGGDPILNTFINYPDQELVGLIFHELAHQKVYAADDSAFNESFATAVEKIGWRQWQSQSHGFTDANPMLKNSSTDTERDALRRQKRDQFKQLTRHTRQQLLAIYKAYEAQTIQKDLALAQKAQVMLDFKNAYQQFKQQWQGDSSYDAWAFSLNNAALVSDATYDVWVDAFIQLYDRQKNWASFYAAAQALADTPYTERQAQLKLLLPPAPKSKP
jgi:predicted aminopeptidase